MTNKLSTRAARSVATTRHNFDFTDKAIEQLDDLKDKLGVTSRAEAIRYAIGVLNWVTHQAEEGNYVIAVNSGSGTVKELSVPPLDEIRNRIAHTRAGKRGLRGLFSRGNDR